MVKHVQALYTAGQVAMKAIQSTGAKEPPKINGFQFSPVGELHVAVLIDENTKNESVRTLVEHRYETALGPIVIPPGFRSDFDSTPWFMQWRFRKLGKQSRAGLYHDFLTRNPLPGMTREVADAIFYQILRLDGFSYVDAKAMYLGVRVGGWKSWNDHRREALLVEGSND